MYVKLYGYQVCNGHFDCPVSHHSSEILPKTCTDPVGGINSVLMPLNIKS